MGADAFYQRTLQSGRRFSRTHAVSLPERSRVARQSAGCGIWGLQTDESGCGDFNGLWLRLANHAGLKYLLDAEIEPFQLVQKLVLLGVELFQERQTGSVAVHGAR